MEREKYERSPTRKISDPRVATRLPSHLEPTRLEEHMLVLMHVALTPPRSAMYPTSRLRSDWIG